MAIKFADVIVDLQYGDTGKGKVAHALAASGDYNMVLRYNGGSNAGHTVYHNGKKVVTHQVPIGVLFGIKSVIGLGCVVHIESLKKEITELNEAGFVTKDLIFIDKRAHVVTISNWQEDQSDEKIGTTRQGIGPAYRNKYGRTGLRIENLHKLAPELWNTGEYTLIDFHKDILQSEKQYEILCEGAQGFHLDIDWGEYPYVTSSHCTVGSACLNGIPPQKIRKVIGTMKAYETYVGNRTDYTDSENEVFKKIAEVGQEFGATTGRPRKVNWLHMNRVIQAIQINGCTDIIINKADILKEVGIMKYTYNGATYEYDRLIEFQTYVDAIIKRNTDTTLSNITWSMTPHGI
jgi:adenylosuccinate synthase